ncbi:MAG: DUF4011 domain-containing protein, partial [Ancalomicrobiaceae bacterium]|nr:DUF4011 domain-containing protein [Ancalomicrobiaceae bacterium]
MTATSVKSPPDAGDERLNGLYDRLRERLLDLSNRNPMLNTRLSGLRSRRFVQIVDDAPEDIYRRLIDGNGTGLDLLALSEPDRLPADERTEEFLSSLAHAKLADTEYLEAVAHLEREGRDDEASLAAAEEALRLKLRDDLGLPPRPGTTEMARADHARSLGIDPALDLPAAREAPHAAARGLQTLKYPDELEATLDRLSDDARLAAQETGLSTLYLALGFLERSESEASERLFLAPLLLLPVRLEERRLRGRLIYSIVPTAGAADTNLSLEKLVEQTEGRQLPAFGANDEDELAGIEAYFAAVAAAIDGLPRWKVRRFAVIGHFASGRFALYQDLSRENWRQPPTTHRLVRAILEGTDRPGAEVADLRPPEDYDIDAPEIETVVPHLVADADASQHSALIDAARGADLVIEGPPGTGKSQTIANLIAHAIGEGKRVLFLAEKQAALDVVKRRLDSAGLGDFCLELHSDKAVPKLVVAALKERAELDPKSVAAAALAGTDDVAHASSRAALSAYVADLHAPAEDGETPFRLIWRALAGYSAAPEECEALRPVLPSADWMGRGSQQAAVVHALDLYAHAAVEFARSHGPVGASPWAGTALADIPPFDLLRVRAALIQWREPLSQLAIVAGEGGDLGVRTLADLVGLTAAETELGVPPEADLVADMAAFELDAAEASLDCLVRFADCQARIAATPELAEAPRRVTARAAELMASRLGPALGDRIPADLSSVTRRRIAEAEELIEAVSGLEPAVALIGLDRDLGGEIYEAIAAVCRTLARLPSAGRVRLAAYARLDEAIVAEAKARLDDLSAAESDWRNLFPGFALADAPRSGEVRQTARWLARNGLSRVFSGLGADAGVARAVIRKLAIPAGADLRLLEQLADYLAFTEGFAADPAYLVAFGPAWAGIATPFAEITAAASLRRAFLAGLKAFAHGETVAAATLSSGPSG